MIVESVSFTESSLCLPEVTQLEREREGEGERERERERERDSMHRQWWVWLTW